LSLLFFTSADEEASPSAGRRFGKNEGFRFPLVDDDAAEWRIDVGIAIVEGGINTTESKWSFFRVS
jgi:hypothetical protein